MKIANIIEDGRIAGPQLRMLVVAEKLKARGVNTVIVFPRADSNDFSTRLAKQGIESLRVDLTRLQKASGGLLRYLSSFPAEVRSLSRLFRSGGFDLVHCSGGFWQVKGLVAAKLAGVNSVWHINDTILPSAFKPLFRLTARLLASHLIFAGHRVKEHYIGSHKAPTRFTIVQAPTNCSFFDPDACTPDEKLAGHGQTLTITCVANLNPLKGLEYFVEMAAILSRDHPSLSFHLVGPAYDSQRDYVRELELQVTRAGLSNVFFHGATNNVRGVLKATDIYVCSSVAEASPTSVWEAMAMGRPIVSTDVGDVKAVMAVNQAGVVVPIKSGQALAAAVNKLIRDAPLRRELGRRARQTAIDHLDLEACVDGHVRAYNAAAGKEQEFTHPVRLDNR